MSKPSAASRTCQIVVAVLGLWLVAGIVLSWAAIQDDALIHLRYADNLYRHHFITYDGVHPNYGASSLLYVGLLALLRGATASPDLARAVSSAVHLLLFGWLAFALAPWRPTRSKAATLAGMVLLTLLVTPSAMRWLDDGMETGLAVLLSTMIVWMIHKRAVDWPLREVSLGLLAFAAVLLRTELLLLCGVGFLMLFLEERPASASGPFGSEPKGGLGASKAAMAGIAVGTATALGVILSTMHVLLPDTALAKSHGIGHWFNPIHDTAVTLAGAFSFGAGMLAFWLLTLGLVAMRGKLTLRTALANSFCPVVLAMSSLRGQEIQGVRYFAWTLFVPAVWNTLELGREGARPPQAEAGVVDRRGVVLLYVFAGLLAAELPMESVAMLRVLAGRSKTMRVFKSQHLEGLKGRHGVASDIGYIGYFTGAEICDLAGLVNGRAAARLSSRERLTECLKTNPDFIFLSRGQYGPMAAVTLLDGWKVCGEYDFTNVRAADRHYLLVRPEIAEEACWATGRQPETVAVALAAWI